MALRLVVTTPFLGYARGSIISNPATIDQIRASEYASAVVLVSDTVIPPPDPPPALTMAELLSAYRDLQQTNVQTQQALNAVVDVNLTQAEALRQQDRRISEVNNSVLALAARVDNPNGGGPRLPDVTDDKPLSEDDGIVLSTDAGSVLHGDVR